MFVREFTVFKEKMKYSCGNQWPVTFLSFKLFPPLFILSRFTPSTLDLWFRPRTTRSPVQALHHTLSVEPPPSPSCPLELWPTAPSHTVPPHNLLLPAWFCPSNHFVSAFNSLTLGLSVSWEVPPWDFFSSSQLEHNHLQFKSRSEELLPPWAGRLRRS